MTVAELINWLSAHNPEATVYLEDPDTNWFLPLRTGSELGFAEDSKYGREAPPGAVFVHAEYYDRWKPNE